MSPVAIAIPIALAVAASTEKRVRLAEDLQAEEKWRNRMWMGGKYWYTLYLFFEKSIKTKKLESKVDFFTF